MKFYQLIVILFTFISCSFFEYSPLRSVASITPENSKNCIEAVSSFKETAPIGSLGSDELPFGWKLTDDVEARLSKAQLNTLSTIDPDNRIWDIKKLSRVNLPVPVASLKNREKFSTIKVVRQMDVADINGKPVRPRIKKNGKEVVVEESYGHNVRMMLAKLPGGEFLFPKELEQFREAADLAMEFFEKKFDDLDDYNIYVSIHQGKVVKDNTQARLGKSVGDDIVAGKRTGAHVDGYQVADHIEDRTIDHTMMVSDNVPTEFFNHGFEMDQIDYQSALSHFDDTANMDKVVYPQNYVLSLIDAYAVHRMGIALEDGQRSFIKFKLSKRVFNQEGNTLNPLIDYEKLSLEAREGKVDSLWEGWVPKEVNVSEGRGMHE